MKKIRVLLGIIALFTAAFVFGAENELIKLEATASFYAEDFHGRPTASGELFDMNALTAAHKTLPFGTMLEICNLENGRKVTVRVNDRGPFIPNREIDVSKGAAEKLDMISSGVARVSIRKTAGPSGQASTLLVKTAGPVTTTSASSTKPNTVVANEIKPGNTALWRIQLAAFSNEPNATRFAGKLRSEGFNPAFEKLNDITRVVLSGIKGTELTATKSRLDGAGYTGYLVRVESR